MQISFIVPTLNEEAVIGAALQTLQSARVRGHEVIIVDGGSKDGTLALCTGLVNQIVSSERGRARQMNAGAAIAHGDILVFLHADTQLPADADLHVLVTLARAECVWGRFDIRLAGGNPVYRLIEFMMNLRSRVSGIATGDQTIFVRRNIFQTLGGYPDIPLMEDIAICRTLKRFARPHCLRARAVTSCRRWEKRGILRTMILMWRLRLAYALGVSAQRLAEYYD
ncbi:MAG: TIGR04283 family arsenosugar biosynthesis glycosyltransferase [Gammaproteobacteria bacterium]